MTLEDGLPSALLAKHRSDIPQSTHQNNTSGSRDSRSKCLNTKGLLRHNFSVQKVYHACNVACKLVVKATQHTCVHGDLIVLKLSCAGSLLLPPETSIHVWLLFALKHTGIGPTTTYKEHSVVVRFLLFALNQSGIGPWSQLVTNILAW